MEKSEFIQIKRKLRVLGSVPENFCHDQLGLFSFLNLLDLDASSWLQLRNASHVREMSQDQKQINLEMHASFLKNYDDFPRLDFGCIRAETNNLVGGVGLKLGVHGTETSNFIGDSKMIGCNLAKPMLGSLLRFVSSKFTIRHLVAVIRPENERSISVYRGLGFTQRNEKDGFLIMEIDSAAFQED